ncbi:MAG: translocation/assembly module TamB domain-containing protein [bacterium]|nr:translocation/assembly module TamB domain-containing protein [bacterium]
MRARLLKITAWFLLALFVLIAGGLGLALTPGVQTAAARRILRAAAADMTGTLAFERAHVRPDGRIVLRNVSLADDSGRVVLAFDSLRARVRLPALLHDSIHVRELAVGSLRLNVSFDSSGASNLERALSSRHPRPPDPTTSPSAWILRADTVTIRGHDFRAELPDIEITLPEWSLAASATYGNDSAKYDMHFDAPERLELAAAGSLLLGQPLNALQGELALRADSAFLSSVPAAARALGDCQFRTRYESFSDSLWMDATFAASRLGNIAATATIPFPPLTLAGHGELHLQRVTPSNFATFDNDAEINGTIRFSKTDDDAILNGWNVAAEFTDCRYGAYRLPYAECTASTLDSVASVRFFSDTGFGSLDVTGSAHGLDPMTTRVDATAEFRRVNLHHFVREVPDSLAPLSGGFHVNSYVLNPEQLKTRIEVRLDTVRLGRYEVAALEASAEIQGDSLRLDTLMCAIPGGVIGARAQARRGRDLAYALRIEIPDLAVARPVLATFTELPETFAGSVAAAFAGHARLTGDSLAQVLARGDARLDSFRYDDLTLQHAEVDIAEASLDSLRVRGTLIAETLCAAEQKLDSISLAFDATPERASVIADLRARADSLQLAAVFDVSRRDNELTVTLDRMRAEMFGIVCESEGVSTITLADGRADVDWLQLRSPMGVLRASGSLRRHGEQDLAIELSGLRTGALASLLPVSIPDSRMNLRAQITGPDTAMIGDLFFSADSVVLDGTPLADKVRLQAIVDRAGTSADGFLIWLGDTLTIFSSELPLRISAAEGIVLADSLPMSGDVQILTQPLDKLNPYLPFGMELGGTLSGDLTFCGTPAAPDWQGTFDVDSARYRDSRVGVDYRDVTIIGRLDRDTLRISRFDARSGGTLSGSGQAIMAFPLPSELNLELAFENFEAVRGPQMTMQASGDVSVSGPLNRLTARGNVQTDHVLYRITQATTKTIEDIDLDAELAKLRGDTAEPGFLLSELYIPMSHELVVDVPGNCWLRGNGVNIELSGKLWLTKSPGLDPSIVGDIAVREGRLQFLGKALRVTEGTVRYDGPVDNPTLDIRATSPQLTAQGTTIEVRIYGPLAETQVELTGTDPDGQSMTPDQVILALFMGRWRAGGSGVGLGPTSAAVEGAAANAATSQLSGLIGQWAGLDVFEYRPGEGGLGDLSSGSLEVGTYVTDRLFMRVIQPVEQLQTGQEVSVEYRLLNWLKLRAQQNGTQSSAFDLFMQVDWR